MSMKRLAQKGWGPHSASGPLTVRPVALARGDPSHTGVCGYGCVGYAIVGYVTVGYVFTDFRLCSVLESRLLNFRYCV